MKSAWLYDAQALEELVAELYQRYGKIDVLINNAGYGIFEDFDKISDQGIHQMFEVNTFALMNLSRLVASGMKEIRQGHIINIVSMAGLIATAKSSLYSATKFAAIGFSNALRLELMPYGVYVTTVNPGPIRTGFFDQADLRDLTTQRNEHRLPVLTLVGPETHRIKYQLPLLRSPFPGPCRELPTGSIVIGQSFQGIGNIRVIPVGFQPLR